MFTSPSTPPPSAQEIDAFVSEQFCGKLIASDAQGFPQVSLLPFVRQGDALEVHMVQDDPTCVALRHAGRGAFLFDEPLAFTPHHVVSDDVASFATLHFLAVLFRIEAEVSLRGRLIVGKRGREPLCMGQPHGCQFSSAKRNGRSGHPGACGLEALSACSTAVMAAA